MQQVLNLDRAAKFNTNAYVNIIRKNQDIREYIDHVENGIPLRKIAHRDGVHPSTVLRRIRKIEARR